MFTCYCSSLMLYCSPLIALALDKVKIIIVDDIWRIDRGNNPGGPLLEKLVNMVR